MKQQKNIPPKQQGNNMLNQKTNEDFNRKMPDPKDPNEEKDRPEIAPPDFEIEETKPLQGETHSANNEFQKPPHKSEGSE